MRYLSISKIITLLAIPFIFILIIPPTYFENGTSFCLIKNLFGVDCPGCGTTRAIHSIFHFQFIKAWDYNKSIIIVFPLLGYVWFKFLIIKLSSLFPDNSALNKVKSGLKIF